MKKFDLKLAKAGHPVCTRDGKSARIVCFDSKTNYPIIGLITYCENEESIVTYTEKGTVLKGSEHDLDLMMVSEVEESDIKEAIKYAIAASTHEDGILLNGVTESEAIAWLKKQGEYNLIENYPIFRVGDCIRNKKTNDKVLIEQLDIATKTYWHVSYDGAAVNHSDFPFSQQNEWELIEQKIVEPKFKVGDWIIHNKNIELSNSLMLVTGKDNNEYLCKDIDGQCSYNIEFIDKDYHLWTIQDAKDGDVLVTVNGKRPFMYKGCFDPNNPDSPVAYFGIECGGSFRKGRDHGDKFDHWWTGEKVQPATKEQRDLLFKKMKEAGYEWDAEKKELKKIENKNLPTAWSEEDERKLQLLIAMCDDTKGDAATYSTMYREMEELKTWLTSIKDRYTWKKSLATADLENSLCDIQDGYSDTSYEYRILGEAIEFIRCTEPQPHWKPSEEQIQVLEYHISSTFKDTWQYKATKELLEQLKKL